MTVRKGVTVKVHGKTAAKKKPEPTQNHGHKHKAAAHKKPIVAPPRAPADLGVVVAIGPLSPGDDHDLPANKTFANWTLLPLTPSSISFQAQSNWTDGLFPVNGPEHAAYAGGLLEGISFSGRLEPPAYYINAAKVGRLSAVDTGHWLSTGGSSGLAVERRGYTAGGSGGGGGILPAENTSALKTVRDGDGVLHVVESSQIGGPLNVNQELTLQDKYFGSSFTDPPSIPGGTDAVMSYGAVVAQGFLWHEPHDLALMLRDACAGGEVVRLTIGDMYGYNRMVSIRSFTWRVEDSDPDVINYDLTARQHRPNPMPTGSVHHAAKKAPKSYTTKNGDTLHSIAHLELGNVALASRIVQYNLHTLENLWGNPDGNAVGGKYNPAKESYGPRMVPRRPDRKVGKIRRPGNGINYDAYLRKGIRLTLVKPKPKHAKKKK